MTDDTGLFRRPAHRTLKAFAASGEAPSSESNGASSGANGYVHQTVPAGTFAAGGSVTIGGTVVPVGANAMATANLTALGIDMAATLGAEPTSLPAAAIAITATAAGRFTIDQGVTTSNGFSATTAAGVPLIVVSPITITNMSLSCLLSCEPI